MTYEEYKQRMKEIREGAVQNVIEICDRLTDGTYPQEEVEDELNEIFVDFTKELCDHVISPILTGVGKDD